MENRPTTSSNTNKEAEEEMGTAFDAIVRHEDAIAPRNLNEIFESYGTSTLEATVPIVDDPELRQLSGVSDEEKLHASLEYQAKSAMNAMQGRKPRTKNREVKLAKLAGKMVIAAGPERDRSPVDKQTLDDELEDYMKVAKQRKSTSSGSSSVVPTPSTTPLTTRKFASRNNSKLNDSKKDSRKDSKDEPIDPLNLEQELDAYMKETSRLREQKRRLAEIHNRARVNDAIEEMELCDVKVEKEH